MQIKQYAPEFRAMIFRMHAEWNRQLAIYYEIVDSIDLFLIEILFLE